MNDLYLNELLELSPYDDSFPARLLDSAFRYRVEEAEKTTNNLFNDILEAFQLPNVSANSEEKTRLVVDVSDEFIQDYKDGAIKLSKEKGHMVAQVKVGNRFGCKLPIKEEQYIDGPDSLAIQNALQLCALQDKLESIASKIEVIEENVREILLGQQNDRLGLYYSGVALFIEANNVSDEAFRKQLLAQSLRALSDASFQLTLNLQNDIRYLANKEYDKNKKSKYDLINERIASIDRAFGAIHQSYIMKAGIYCMNGEIKAMASVLQEYERFINGTILPNAALLESCDSNRQRIEKRVWMKRGGLQLEVDTLVKQINSPEQILYIEENGELADEDL